jgi:predicted NBD/HSP70 family sugar kinase
VSEQIPETRLGAGRPSHVVVPRRDGAYVLAASVGDDAVTVAAVCLGGAILTRKEFRVNGRRTRPQVIAGRVASELLSLQQRMAPGSWAAGVGIGVPGIVRRTDGHIELAPNLGWENVPFGALVAERLGLGVPLQVGNDADLGALAEHVRGAGQGVGDLIYLAGEVGLGGGLIVDGRMLHGFGGYAGEIGHLLVNPNGRPCRCGSSGCLETEVSGQALLVAAGLPDDSGHRAVLDLITRAGEGEPVAAAAADHVARWLGRGVASLVNVFNPELVLLGGVLSPLYALARDVVRGELADRVIAAPGRQVRLESPALGTDAVLVGAAEVAFEAAAGRPARGQRPPGGSGAVGSAAAGRGRCRSRGGRGRRRAGR